MKFIYFDQYLYLSARFQAYLIELSLEVAHTVESSLEASNKMKKDWPEGEIRSGLALKFATLLSACISINSQSPLVLKQV